MNDVKEKIQSEETLETLEELELSSHEGSDENEEMQEKPDYGEEIKAIIRSNASPKIMKAKLEDYHANDIAVILDELTAAQRIKVYRVLDDVMLSDILEYLDEDDASRFLGEMDPKRAAAVITEIEPDVAVAILRQIPRERRTLLIDLLDEESRNDVRLIASFDEEEIGSRMTTNYIAIRENLTIKEAMSELIRQAAENDNISTIFVVDETQEFYGAIDLKELIIARQGSNLEDLIVTSFPYVYGHENIDDCIEKLKDYQENNIPVHSGVYLQVTGPQYETPAEIEMYRSLGADTVAMSLAAETIAARHMGMKVCGINCVSNMAAGMEEEGFSHDSVTEEVGKSADNYKILISGLLDSLAEE